MNIRIQGNDHAGYSISDGITTSYGFATPQSALDYYIERRTSDALAEVIRRMDECDTGTSDHQWTGLQHPAGATPPATNGIIGHGACSPRRTL